MHARFELGNLEDAKADATLLIERDGCDSFYVVAGLKLRAKILSQLGKKEEALDDLNRALKLAPDDSEIYDIKFDLLMHDSAPDAPK